MKRSFIGFAILILVFAAFGRDAHAGFNLSLSPIRWEVRAEAGETVRTLIRLTSGRRTVQKVRPAVGDWTLTDQGTPQFFPAGTRSDSAAGWLRFVEEDFSVYPRQKKNFKLSLTVPELTPPGSYLAALFFEPPAGGPPEEPGSTTMFLRGRLAFLIYVTVGAAEPHAEILEAAWRKIPGKAEPVAALKIVNRGSAHLRTLGIFSARAAADRKPYEGRVVSVPILPGRVRWVPLAFSGAKALPGTALQLQLRVDLGQGEQQVDMALNGITEDG